MTDLLGPDGSPIGLSGVSPNLSEPGPVVIDNRTELPDGQVQHAIATYFEEHGRWASADGTNFRTYVNDGNGSGSLLARRQYQSPRTVFDEIRLARDLADRDDDVGATIGSMLALAFGEGMQNAHSDEVTVALYNEVAKNANLDHAFKAMYREYLIAASLTTVSLYTRESFSFIPEGTERYRTRSIVAPLIGILKAECIRVIGNNVFGTAPLAYLPDSEKLKMWLEERFNPHTTPARLNEMRREDPVAFALYTGKVQLPYDDSGNDLFGGGQDAYKLNPRMVNRTTMPCDGPYPHPPLLKNFALLEAKRLLNIMDYALLQGGANFIVIAKKGTDDRPAVPGEVENLREVVRGASKTGVIVGDHRLSLEIITPKLEELLNAEKRKLLGRKLAMALLRVPEHATEEAGSEGAKSEVEVMTRVITSDRRDLKRHVEKYIYEDTAKRNTASFLGGPARIWFPKIILQGTNYFTDMVLKLRDRGDISRRAAVEAGGWDYTAQVEQRRREKANGDDKVMTPGEVPFSSPQRGPQDQNPGRTPGGTDPARPRQTIRRTPGETIRAEYVERLNKVVRMGHATWDLLETHPSASLGRITQAERDAAAESETVVRGKKTIIPVNKNFSADDLSAIRLDDKTSVIVGKDERRTVVAKALVFKETSKEDAEDQAIEWGFDIEIDGEVVGRERPRESKPQELHVHLPSGKTKKTVIRDETGQIIGTTEEPVEDDPED